MGYWTNSSVLRLAGDADPVEVMQKRTRGIVLNAIQEGWTGPPFDPFELAEYLRIPTALPACWERHDAKGQIGD